MCFWKEHSRPSVQMCIPANKKKDILESLLKSLWEGCGYNSQRIIRLLSKQNQRVTPQYKQTIHAGQKFIIGPVDLSALNSEQVEGLLSKNSMRYWHVLDKTTLSLGKVSLLVGNNSFFLLSLTMRKHNLNSSATFCLAVMINAYHAIKDCTQNWRPNTVRVGWWTFISIWSNETKLHKFLYIQNFSF